ncbi:MAG: GntR family transcriptional regulator [Candidatus Kryptoniota bacterium]
MEKKKNKKKYELLTEQLIDLIKKDNLKQNDRLPTVREMIKRWNFSYATVHRTLIEMENKGLITRQQGKGMYVDRLDVKPADKQVALIIPSDFSGFRIFIDILTGVRTALEKKKISLLISISNMSHEKEKVTIERLISRNVDGMIIFLEDHYRHDYSHIARLKEDNFPFVLIDRFIPELDTDYVVVHNRVAMYRICSYLKYNMCCDKIVFVPDTDSPENISSSEEKLAGFMESINILYGEENGTVLCLDDLVPRLNEMSKTSKNIGVCMHHDGLITILHRRLQEQDMMLPTNCHLFGYNNSFETPLYPTVEQFNEKVGMKAAEILIEKMNDPDKKTVQVRVEPKLILPDKIGGFYMED